MTKPTLNSLIDDLEQVKAQAIANGQLNSVINAIALQAKLLGLDDGKAIQAQESTRPTQIIVNVKKARKRDDNLALLPEYQEI